MKRLFSHLTDLLLRGDLALARATVAFASLLWAAILLFGGPQFDRPSYVYLAQIASQQTWGAMFGIVGLVQMIRVIFKTPVTSGVYACFAAALIAWLWCAVAAALALSIQPPPGMVAGNVAVAALSALIFIRTVARRE
jgi:hypothetical protein